MIHEAIPDYRQNVDIQRSQQNASSQTPMDSPPYQPYQQQSILRCHSYASPIYTSHSLPEKSQKTERAGKTYKNMNPLINSPTNPRSKNECEATCTPAPRIAA